MSRSSAGTRTVVILNEPFAEMRLGKNTTLAYIASCLEKGHEVHLHDVSRLPAINGQVFPRGAASAIPTICLNDNPGLCRALVAAYKHYNSELKDIAVDQIERHGVDGYSFDSDRRLTTHPVPMVGEFVTREETLGAIPAETKMVPANQFGLVLQRLEPMKGPFPPVGEADFKTGLTQLQQLFPDKIFSCPNGEDIGDKQGPILIDEALARSGQAAISTPTAEFTMDDGRFSDAFATMCATRLEMFSGQPIKVVIKPKDSAQSLGVFALKIIFGGHNLASLKKMKLTELTNENFQILEVSPDLSKDEMEKVMLVMLYVQSLKTDPAALKLLGDKTAGDVDETELSATARRLYHGEIQVQPFLEGVSKGDIRVNLAKDEYGNFVHIGSTFRAKLAGDPAQFTTCYTSGKATSAPTDLLLNKEEQASLKTSIKLLCDTLNCELRETYKNCGEIGVDFLVSGDGKNVKLGEANHTCPALVPLSEMLEAALAEAKKQALTKTYGGGLARTGDFVDATLMRQEIMREREEATKRNRPSPAIPVRHNEAIPYSQMVAAGGESHGMW